MISIQNQANTLNQFLPTPPVEIIIKDAQRDKWLYFKQPLTLFETHDVNSVAGLLERIESQVNNRGLIAVGFLSYEAAPAFDDALVVRSSAFSKLWFGLFETWDEIDLDSLPSDKNYRLGRWSPSMSRNDYEKAIRKIKDHIRCGDTYQVNFTYQLHSSFSGDALAYFRRLNEAQGGRYAAFISSEKWIICSVSPELFFHLEGEDIVSKPMKGTVASGKTTAENREKTGLLRSEKNRAENIMIVDMIRNDLGRIARMGQVRVRELFSAEVYPTVLQMTSTVAAKTNASIRDIFAALFPCASITGAPKVKTMRIISELESNPRGLYTGAIGFMAPGRRAQFNVAIRTVVIDKTSGKASYGIGGGIVWDSDAADEYRESLTKARVLDRRLPHFRLLETMLWTAESGFFLLDLHLQRLADSAQYFGFRCDQEHIRPALCELAKRLHARPHKIRLLLAKNGSFDLGHEAIDPEKNNRVLAVRLAKTPVHSGDVFLYHKTTHRQFYNKAKALSPRATDDVILWNEKKQATESTIANIVIKKAGQYFTPPVHCGLLAGTFRQHLLNKKEIAEKEISVDELRECDELFLINSVRKWMRAELH